VLGPQTGLPAGLAVSGHNQFWGAPAGRGDPVIVVSSEGEDCFGAFRERVLAARLPFTPYAMPDEERHLLWICLGALSPTSHLIDAARHLE
jgi:hypothetical protein